MSNPAPELPSSSVRVLAQGPGWRVSDVVCRRGPGDRRFEEQHAGVSLAAVLAGTFNYRSRRGEALLYPGAILLGDAGACFECGHEHGHGDRCLAVSLDPALFEEIAHGASGRARSGFARPMLPLLHALAAPLQVLQARLRDAAASGIEEALLQFAETVVRTAEGACPRHEAIAPREQRRLAGVLRHIEADPQATPDLEQLAALACMSKYHFLRRFRRALGITPHQYLLRQRLQRAARALLESRAPVATLAFEAGFGDLSTFNAQFRAAFGTSPGGFRRRH
jgi:AraC family transcriptional regulator